MFAIQFFRELLHIFEAAPTLIEVDLILMALTLIDLTLVASLIVMVMLSGYENFVSKLDLEGTEKVARLARQARRRVAEDQGRGVDRRDLLDPSSEGVHELQLGDDREDDPPDRDAPHFRGLGAAPGRSWTGSSRQHR